MKAKIVILTALLAAAVIISAGCRTTAYGDEGGAEIKAEASAKIHEEAAEANAEKSAEEQAERQAEERDALVMGGWTEHPADTPDLTEALDWFNQWLKKQWNKVEPDSLPGAWSSLAESEEPAALDESNLAGGATQVVSGQNIRLDLTPGEDGEIIAVYIYRDFSGKREVLLVETAAGYILYQK